MARGTRPRRERDPLERDMTPAWAAEAAIRALDRVEGIRPQTVYEPCCGDGAFVKAARDAWPDAEVFATDVDPDAVVSPNVQAFATSAGVVDVATIPKNADIDADLIVTNFPFSRAEDFIRILRPHTEVLAAILPLSFLASASRAAFWEEYPVDQLYVFSKRIAFESPTARTATPIPADARRNGRATASQDLALFVWGVEPGPTRWIAPPEAL